jgi:hypothetical protein
MAQDPIPSSARPRCFPGWLRLGLGFALAHLLCTAAIGKPLKVFILAGQSNMEGHARIETFDYIGDDPVTAPLLQQMRGPDGKPRVCDGAWISYFTGNADADGEGMGPLTAGYGSRSVPDRDGGKIGPEFTFGLTMDAALEEPVLIIKVAWGGKSLHTDFRSPSAGPYQLSSFQRENYPKQEGHGIPKDFEQWKADKARETGLYYRRMIGHVRKVLADVKRVCPQYDPAQGYEIGGFVWFQGWNDMVDGHVYPNHHRPDRFALYSELLAHFIRDVRRDLNAPTMPFVIGVMGVGGANPGRDVLAFREAMTAPSLLPEFNGNVIAVPTAPFWSEELGAIADKQDKVRQMRYYLDSKHKDHANADGHMTEEQKQTHVKRFESELISPEEVAVWKRGASNAGYHYLGCAKSFALMGRAFAETTLQMMRVKVGKPSEASKVPANDIRQVGPPPTGLKLPAFYTKYIEADGYPIVASDRVNDYALREAAYLVNLMLAKRPDVRAAMIKSGSRMCIIAHNEFTTDLPEWAHMTPKAWWDSRARGTGGSAQDPFCSCGEENLLGYQGDPYAAENILIHEFAHNIHLRGMVNVDPTFDGRVKAAYDHAMKAGLWKGKYASVNHHEYFAEGVQTWFDNNRVNDHDHNHVHLRSQLIEYDPGLAALCREVFGDTELKYSKPATRLTGHLEGYDPSSAPRFVWPDRLSQVRDEIRREAQARSDAANAGKAIPGADSAK